MNDFAFRLLVFIALAPAFYYLGVVLTNGLRNIPVLAPLGRLIGAVCFLAAGAGGLAIAGAATLGVLAVLMAAGSLVLVVAVPLVAVGIIMAIGLEPAIARMQNHSPSAEH